MSIVRDYIAGQFRDVKAAEVGIGGYTALVRIQERVTRSSDVPVVYLEDGTPVSDHIIRKPLKLFIEGNVSDVYIRPSVLIPEVRRVQDQLGVITQYLPTRTQAQASRVSALVNDIANAVDRVDEEIRRGRQLAGYVGLIDDAVASNVDGFISNMETHFFGSTLISIEMPSRTYENMRITSLDINRDNEHNAVSFRMDATQVNFVATRQVPVGVVKAVASAVDGQLDEETEKGVQTGEKPPHSFLDYLFSMMGEHTGQV